jgi:hypothetical protein
MVAPPLAPLPVFGSVMVAPPLAPLPVFGFWFLVFGFVFANSQ